MAIRTIEAVVKIDEDRRLIVQLPSDIPLGRHRVVAVLDEATEEPLQAASGSATPWTFPVLANAQWAADMPISRAEMYDDDGR